MRTWTFGNWCKTSAVHRKNMGVRVGSGRWCGSAGTTNTPTTSLTLHGTALRNAMSVSRSGCDYRKKANLPPPAQGALRSNKVGGTGDPVSQKASHKRTEISLGRLGEAADKHPTTKRSQ